MVHLVIGTCLWVLLQLLNDYIPLPTAAPPHKLCVIVPFRDRDEELSEFAPHIDKFLREQGIEYYLLLMNQTDDLRFNRASLINVGWLECDRVGCDYMVMHDVDLLPLNSEISYRFPGEGVVRHISSPLYHPKYNYSKFIGGILMLTMNDYKALNGMSNKYWGWGLEDDEFFLRIKDAALNLTRVENLSSNRLNTFRHLHGPKRKRDYAVVTKEQKSMKKRRDYISGLNNVSYNITARRIRSFGEASVHVVDVQLFCDMSWTPYCKLPSRR
uniref:Beta1,4-galactosyltransferase 7 n=1 Tax=Angiostrongylus cantonensis TaxID=6313 RepID=A0A0K0DHI2_ANGCA